MEMKIKIKANSLLNINLVCVIYCFRKKKYSINNVYEFLYNELVIKLEDTKINFKLILFFLILFQDD